MNKFFFIVIFFETSCSLAMYRKPEEHFYINYTCYQEDGQPIHVQSENMKQTKQVVNRVYGKAFCREGMR